jgi:hypothetical protein
MEARLNSGCTVAAVAKSMSHRASAEESDAVSPTWNSPKVSDLTLLGVFTGRDAWSNVIDLKDWDCGGLGEGEA